MFSTHEQFIKDIPPELRSLKLLITIVDRGKGEKVAEICRKHRARMNMIFLGKGTANSEILNYLSLGETLKDIIITVLPTVYMDKLLEDIIEGMKLHKPGNGIAFTVPISSIGGTKTFKTLVENHAGKE